MKTRPAPKADCKLCFNRIIRNNIEICRIKNVEVTNRDINCPCSYFAGELR